MRTWTGDNAPVVGRGTPGEPNILDLVMHLGRARRFGGFGSTEYTVLHHSMLVGMLWLIAEYPREQVAYAFLHDAHEAYLGDMPSPVKDVFGREHVAILEKKLDTAIFKLVHLPSTGPGTPEDPETKRRIKVCDYAALVIEGGFFPPRRETDALRTVIVGGVAMPYLDNVPADFLPAVKELVQKATPLLTTWLKNHNRLW